MERILSHDHILFRLVHRAAAGTALLLAVLLAGCATMPPSAAPSDNMASEVEGPLVVEHPLGETVVPANPERIVALEWSYVESLLALGIQPVGVADIDGYHSWVQIPVALDESVVDVGTRQSPNLETLAGLQPDLIIAPSFRVAEIYEQLSAIAPTVTFDAYPTDPDVTQYAAMRANFITIADMTGRHSDGEQVLADMEAAFVAARDRLDAAELLGEPFVLAQAFGEDTVQVRLFTDNAMAVEIVELIGLENSWSDAEFQQYGFTTVSVETLPELGDLRFFYVVQDDNNVFARAAIQPLWESLAFVASDHAYGLGGDTWLFGGPLSAEVLVDKIIDLLLPGGSPVTEAASADTACAAGMRAAASYGPVNPVCVPTAPQRVVVLDAMDNVMALGLQPIGAANWMGTATGEQAAFPGYLNKAALAEIEWLGDNKQPSLERIVALQPDLILGRNNWHLEIYDQLSAIAPTVLVDQRDAGGWRAQFLAYAAALNRTTQAEALLADYDARAEKIAARLAAREPIPTVSLVRFDPSRIVIYGNQIFAGSVMADAGVARPSAQAEDMRSQEISVEEIDLIDADILLMVQADADESILATLQENPLWQQLGAVQTGAVYAVPFDTWVGGWTITGANLILDDLERILLGTDASN